VRNTAPSLFGCVRPPVTPIGKIFLEYFEPMFNRKKRKEEDFYYTGDPEDYVRLVFRRYGRDGSYPAKRGHTILILVLGVGLVLSFTLA
jgi:hypothetical protein